MIGATLKTSNLLLKLLHLLGHFEKQSEHLLEQFRELEEVII